ncbi:hypothetical protein H206_05190 [Candidatus Electrothrix aarhusensis]|uniref:Uncharacterized protein n=1 Tax=Candidatus Electrothrix aarhusensis TaxID=1859131 RepID=A0A3S4TDJ6_9BACT|nr:hypothetical protein H206_05190 [Candidatus Electrothrix aarhusensis]
MCFRHNNKQLCRYLQKDVLFKIQDKICSMTFFSTATFLFYTI